MDFRSFNIRLKETSGLGGGKKRIYATVSMVGGSSPKQKASIENHIPKFGSSSIRSCFLRFYVENTKLQYNQLVLMIQILQKRILRCDKVIGEVCVSLKELYDVFTTNFGFQPIVMVKTLGNNNNKKKKTVPQGFLCFTYRFGDLPAGFHYPLIRTPSRVTPSAPCLEYLTDEA
ncbi:hypothetical protein HN51_028000 [Arachis hypogaea]|nr:uncharacterized protein DS421_9g267080 [Arachis hypogaea]